MSPRRQFSLFEGRAPDNAESVLESVSETENSLMDPPERLPDGKDPENPIPVSTLNSVARDLLEGTFHPLWVLGEVTNWRVAASGHRYFSLRDDRAQIQCVLFQGDAWRLPTDPEEGMEVCAFGQVSLYPQRGRYQLIVRNLQAKGEGLWRLAFERLRRALQDEGLLDPARKRPLPVVPRRIGIVTSRGGAALRDILTIVRRRAPWTSVLVRDCRVQGDGAGVEICSALETLGRHPGVDLIILTRGGGSVEDLWCFNEENVARAVAACPVPVVSAVGHEIDVTIVDLVADVRAPTPSAAAEMAVPDGDSLRARMQRFSAGLVMGLRRRGRDGAKRAGRLEERLRVCMSRRLERDGARWLRLAERLDALSPLRTLRRGYAVPLSPEGSVLRTTGMFEKGEDFRLRVSDGMVHCRTERVEPDGSK
jgi:exodeoxyribonuclease VII large subunit